MTNITHSVRLGRVEKLQTTPVKGRIRIYSLGQRTQEGNSRSPAIISDMGKKEKAPNILTKESLIEARAQTPKCLSDNFTVTESITVGIPGLARVILLHLHIINLHRFLASITVMVTFLSLTV